MFECKLHKIEKSIAMFEYVETIWFCRPNIGPMAIEGIEAADPDTWYRTLWLMH